MTNMDALVEAGAAVVVNAMGDKRALLAELGDRMRHPFIDLGADCTLPRGIPPPAWRTSGLKK